MLASTGRRLAAGLLASTGSNGSLLNGALIAAADSILFSSSSSSMSIKPSSSASRSLSTDTDIRKVLADKIPEQQVRMHRTSVPWAQRDRQRELAGASEKGENKEQKRVRPFCLCRRRPTELDLRPQLSRGTSPLIAFLFAATLRKMSSTTSEEN